MPWGVAAGVVGSVAGSAINSAMAPSTSGGSGYYIPTGLSAADTTWQNLLNQQYGTQFGLNQIVNQQALQSYADQLAAAKQYGPGYQNAANTAGQQYGALGQQLGTASGLDFGAQQGLLNAGQAVYNTALDPQNALYNRTVQQLQDQTGATNSMYGLGSSAAGAGVANQALSNFNIDWQNQQLQRQLAGLQGYGQAAGQAGQLAGQGGTLGNLGAQATLQGGHLPYTTAQQIAGQPGQIANTYAQSLEQGPLSSAAGISGQIIPYMYNGQGAQSIPYQNAGVNAQNMGQSVASGIGGLGSAAQNAGGWGNLFGGTTGSFGGGDFSGAFTSNPYYSGGGNQYGFTM